MQTTCEGSGREAEREEETRCAAEAAQWLKYDDRAISA